MKILIACEESQAVCKAFRERGHEAYSCDILDCSGGHPEWHIKDDVRNVLRHDFGSVPEWDMVIAFPPCTDLAVSGARWFPKKRADGSQEKKYYVLRVLHNDSYAFCGNRKPNRYNVNHISKTGSDHTAVAIWAW